MTSSLVGSEMCIRDSSVAMQGPGQCYSAVCTPLLTDHCVPNSPTSNPRAGSLRNSYPERLQ
eukprot:6400878-Prorocentrum_lima.AAC.1